MRIARLRILVVVGAIGCSTFADESKSDGGAPSAPGPDAGPDAAAGGGDLSASFDEGCAPFETNNAIASSVAAGAARPGKACEVCRNGAVQYFNVFGSRPALPPGDYSAEVAVRAAGAPVPVVNMAVEVSTRSNPFVGPSAKPGATFATTNMQFTISPADRDVSLQVRFDVGSAAPVGNACVLIDDYVVHKR